MNKAVVVKTMDSDVVILLISYMPQFSWYCSMIYVDFNFGKKQKILLYK